jgi:hypothetical protein
MLTSRIDAINCHQPRLSPIGVRFTVMNTVTHHLLALLDRTPIQQRRVPGCTKLTRTGTGARRGMVRGMK